MPDITVTFVGSGDAIGSGGRNQTCIHVASSWGTFLMDCGPPSLAALKKLALEVDAIDALLLTHAHGDHFGGIPLLLLHFSMTRESGRPLYILAPSHMQKRIKELNLLYFQNILKNMKFPLIFMDMELEKKEIPEMGIQVWPWAMKHQKELLCLGYQIRFPNGRSIAYTGDTGWNDNLSALSRDTDLFITECSFFESPSTPLNHLSYQEIVSNREQLPTQRLILTHMNAAMQDFSDDELAFERAYDGLSISL